MIFSFKKYNNETVVGRDLFMRFTIECGEARVQFPTGFKCNREEILAQSILSLVKDRDLHTVPNLLVLLVRQLEESRDLFKGGMFGALSYDFIRFLEPRLQKFGYFKNFTPESVDAEFVVCRDEVVGSHADTFLEEYSFDSIYESADQIHRSLEKNIGVGETQDINAQRLRKNILALKEHLKAGDIFQAVISEKKQLRLQLTPFEIYSSLPQAPLKFFYPTSDGLLFGASPELLLLADRDYLETHPIAGTRPRGATAEEDALQQKNLLRSSKEKAEHMMLVDLARNDLGRVSVEGSVQVPEMMSVKKFTSVQHLVSRVSGQKLPDMHRFEAMFSCFPAGTLTGAPKVRAMEILASLEEKPRGFYGGCIFHDNLHQTLESYITIRSCIYRNNIFELQAGAGIVLDSKVESEQAEIHNKLKALQKTIEAKNGSSHRQLRLVHLQPETTHSARG